MTTTSVITVQINKVCDSAVAMTKDLVVVEEPLEIRVGFMKNGKRAEFSLSVTMRTPGADEELARGFLISEGIVKNEKEIISVRYCQQAKHPENTIRVELGDEVAFDPDQFKRNFFTSSSCGVCGKAVIDAVMLHLPINQTSIPTLDAKVLSTLSQEISNHQSVFKFTGGLHASALFDLSGDLKMIREDIGRHNALDKLIGASQMYGIDVTDKILWLSGRVGLELVQKAVMSGVKIIVALGAPSSLAVSMAKENMILLIGFLKKESYNIYTEKDSVVLS